MSNLLATGAMWLGGQLKSHAGRTVTIRQGTTTLSGLTATLAMLEHEVQDEQGFLTKVMSADWLFLTADLTTTVRPGAIITDTDSEDRYEVAPIGNKPHQERADALGKLTVLHTKKVA